MSTHLAMDNYLDSLLEPPAAANEVLTVKSAPAITRNVVPISAALLPSHDPATPPARNATSRTTRWLRFELADQSYAIELLKVQEVQRVPDIVPVRGAAAELLGVINLRGQIVPVVDLARKLGFASCDASAAAARIVVLEEHGETMGLLVSAVTEVARLDENCIEHAAAALPAFPRGALIGIARHAQLLTGLLDGSAFLK